MVLNGAIFCFKGAAFRRKTFTAPSISKRRSGTSGVTMGTDGFSGGFMAACRRAFDSSPRIADEVALRRALKPNKPAPKSMPSRKKFLRVVLIGPLLIQLGSWIVDTARVRPRKRPPHKRV